MRAAVVLSILLAASSAAADSPDTPRGEASDLATKLGLRGLPFSFGVNAPFMWFDKSFGGSVSIGFRHHHAIRANVASYDDQFTDLPSLFAGGEGGHSGRINDLGLSYTWYPRALWDGLMLEAGVLRRNRALRYSPEFDPVEKTFTTTYAARMTIGHSWRYGVMYFAIAAGFSAGRETGHEWVDGERGQMPTTTKIDRPNVDPELYLRLGYAFGD